MPLRRVPEALGLERIDHELLRPQPVDLPHQRSAMGRAESRISPSRHPLDVVAGQPRRSVTVETLDAGPVQE